MLWSTDCETSFDTNTIKYLLSTSMNRSYNLNRFIFDRWRLVQVEDNGEDGNMPVKLSLKEVDLRYKMP